MICNFEKLFTKCVCSNWRLRRHVILGKCTKSLLHDDSRVFIENWNPSLWSKYLPGYQYRFIKKRVKGVFNSRHFHFQMKKIQRQKIRNDRYYYFEFSLEYHNFIYVGNFHYLPYLYICLYKYYIHTSLGHQVFCSIFTCHVSRFSRRTQVFSREKRCPHLQNINSFYFFFFFFFAKTFLFQWSLFPK